MKEPDKITKSHHYIHYRSFRNFVLHYDEIKTEHSRSKVHSLLSEYIQDVQANNYDFSERFKTGILVRKYLWNLAAFYKEDSNFMPYLGFNYLLFSGIIVNAILYFTGLNAIICRIPVVTIILLLYHLFVVVFKVPKGRVYGLFY
jgi:hypothetical protein